MIILAIPYYRKGLINDQTGTNDFNKIFRKSNMGDWFMLHQIGKNVDGHYFKLFINELVKTFPNDEMSPKSVCKVTVGQKIQKFQAEKTREIK